MTYLLWYDDSKKPVAVKLAAAIEAYRDRFRMPATVVLTNPMEQIPITGVVVESRSYIRPHNYWVGRDEP